jgi:hypothetical protein
MDFSTKFDDLEQRVRKAKAASQAAATESRDQVEERIDDAEKDLDKNYEAAQRETSETAGGNRSKFAQMKADAAAKRENVKAKIGKRNRETDASMAATEAEWAQSDAVDALEYAGWAVDDARLAVLDAIHAQANADEKARKAAAQQ